MDDFESPDTLTSTKFGQDFEQVRKSSLTNSTDSRRTSLTAGLIGASGMAGVGQSQQPSLSSIVQSQMPAGAQQPRRDSLRNMVHLCDFATP